MGCNISRRCSKRLPRWDIRLSKLEPDDALHQRIFSRAHNLQRWGRERSLFIIYDLFFARRQKTSFLHLRGANKSAVILYDKRAAWAKQTQSCWNIWATLGYALFHIKVAPLSARVAAGGKAKWHPGIPLNCCRDIAEIKRGSFFFA